MNNKLLHVIVSMDSYNRGYNAGINLDKNGVLNSSEDIGTLLGGVSIIATRGQVDAQGIGFYAIAYQYDEVVGEGPEAAIVTKTVISYRGTDQFLDTEDSNGNIIVGGDVFNAYSQGGGDAETNQSMMAIQFYQAVVDAVYGTEADNYNINGSLDNLMVTGHSMGGGLAGLVGGLYALNGTVYSNMAYQQALLNLARANEPTTDQGQLTDLYSNAFYQLINNTNGPVDGGVANAQWLNRA